MSIGQTRRTPENPINHRHEKHEMILRQGHLQPGIMVSIDQYISAIPGRLEHTRGKETKKEKYVGGTIFCDSLRAGDTIQAKRLLESMSASCGVRIKGYHADNVPFDSNEFKQELPSKNQTITLPGTGAHHQNGVAERAIRTVTSWARTMLQHMILHWPEMAELTLWPFALAHATYVWNILLSRETLIAPIEMFSSSKADCSELFTYGVALLTC
jgi:hypothetical protein